MNQDREHLELLAIFHFVVAGLAGLVSLLPLIHLVVGIALATGQCEGGEPVARAIGCFFAAFAATFILLGLAFAACMALAGAYLMRRTHYTFCMVMAAIACLFMPFGTVLGVFTLLVLQRPSVKALFEGAGGAAAPAT